MKRPLLSPCLILLLVSLVSISPSHAQQQIRLEVGEARIVDLLAPGAPPVDPALLQLPPTKVLTFQVPHFKPEDRDTHRYYVVSVFKTGGGASSGKVDEFGILRESVVDYAAMPDTPEDMLVQQYFFLSVNSQTDEVRITLDLKQVNLSAFLHALSGGISHGTTVHHAIPAPPIRRFNHFRPQPDDGSNSVWMDIKGEHLTLDDVLDLVYRETRCEVYVQDSSLVLTSCP